MGGEHKEQTNVRLTPTAKAIMIRLTDLYGVSQGDVLEILLRAEAARLQLRGHINSPLKAGPPLQPPRPKE